MNNKPRKPVSKLLAREGTINWDYDWAAIDGILKLSKIEYAAKQGKLGEALNPQNFLEETELLAVQRLISDVARASEWKPKDLR